jgi:hypothetical protein
VPAVVEARPQVEEMGDPKSLSHRSRGFAPRGHPVMLRQTDLPKRMERTMRTLPAFIVFGAATAMGALPYAAQASPRRNCSRSAVLVRTYKSRKWTTVGAGPATANGTVNGCAPAAAAAETTTPHLHMVLVDRTTTELARLSGIAQWKGRADFTPKAVHHDDWRQVRRVACAGARASSPRWAACGRPRTPVPKLLPAPGICRSDKPGRRAAAA